MQYTGGKNQGGTYHQIINQIPPHKLYIEPFLGSGAILRLKRPAVSTIAIDSDEHVLKTFADHIAKSGEVPDGSRLQIVCANALDFLADNIAGKSEDGPNTFIYCDPPYLMQTRATQQRYYRHEFATENEHRALLRLLKSLSCSIAISGYASDLYANELADWRSISWQVQTRGGHPATEILWMNYPAPLALHDYRYLGSNFRQREKIQRQKRRWLARLKRMDNLQRFAMMDALEEFHQVTTAETAIPSGAHR